MNRSFWDRVEKTDGCWFWRGTIGHKGYGIWRSPIAGQQSIVPHRAAYLEIRGPIPEGLTLHHVCEVKHCVNPDHLVAMPNRNNILLGGNPAAQNARKTHCPRGHAFDEENTYTYPNGRRRRCRTCDRGRLWERAAA